MVLRNFVNPRITALIALGALAIACSNPDAEKRRHFERGNRYAAEQRDDFAVIEYANAVRLDPKFGEARLKLAEAFERMNNPRASFPEFIRAADALPDNRDVQLKATQVLLLSGRFDDAKSRAAALLERDPNDLDAILLHANAMAALKDPDGAVTEIEEALNLRPTESRVFLNLGAVRSRAGDAAEAEAAFKKAVSLSPSSVDARLAFANFLWSRGRQADAEQQLHEALSVKPQHLLANRMLGTLYMATNRLPDAELPLKTVAEVSGLPAARFQLAEYYVTAGRDGEAISLLTDLSANAEMASDAQVLMAALDYSAGRRTEAHTRMDKALLRTPKNAHALSTKARWLAVENKLDAALDRAKAAAAADPQSAEAQFILGSVHNLRREVPDAIKAYNEVLRLNPRAVAAQIELAHLNLATGDQKTALHYAEEAQQMAPDNLYARLAFARSLLANGELRRAEVEITALLKEQTDTAAVHALNGTLQTQLHNKSVATKSFERSLELKPGNLEAIRGLVTLHVQDKEFTAAQKRLDAELGKQPDQAELLALSAHVCNLAGQSDKAEQALRKAVAADPQFAPGFAMLAQLYMKQNRLDEARAEFEQIVKREPSAVGPRTMVGVILETQGRREEAKRWYEATVAAVSNAPVAANNLAFIYAEQNTNLDVALQLATSAKQQLPDSAEVDDTLGWVYYRKDLAALAVRPLEDSLAKRPDNADILYHLGLTYARLGDKAKARDTLARALKINPQMAGADTARQALASVSQ